MDQTKPTLDWTRLQAFLAVAETGSLSAAARKLGASQPTLGRQIAALEGELGAVLFHRQPRGLALTETGSALIEPAQAMQAAAGHIALLAAGQDARLEGTVRITASIAFSVYHLPPILARIRSAEPLIEIELVPSDATTNLLYREADIALRMYRPTQSDLVTRHLGDLELGLFAAESYLARRGIPRVATDLLDHDVIGYDTSPLIEEGFRAAGFPVPRGFFQMRTDDNIAYLELIRAGCGIGFSQVSIARADPRLVHLHLGLDIPRLPLWLTAHQAMRRTPRIRRIWDLLAAELVPLARGP
jgi:DNA-binding transcriptional LysR family regulator